MEFLSLFLLISVISKGDGSSAQESSAQKNCLTPKYWLLDTIQADAQIYATAQKSKKVSFRADAILRPKCTTAQIATAWQKHWKISTALI